MMTSISNSDHISHAGRAIHHGTPTYQRALIARPPRARRGAEGCIVAPRATMQPRIAVRSRPLARIPSVRQRLEGHHVRCGNLRPSTNASPPSDLRDSSGRPRSLSHPSRSGVIEAPTWPPILGRQRLRRDRPDHHRHAFRYKTLLNCDEHVGRICARNNPDCTARSPIPDDVLNLARDSLPLRITTTPCELI